MTKVPAAVKRIGINLLLVVRSTLTAIALCCSVDSSGQLTLDKPYYARVIVPEDIYATVRVREIVIDTLIMGNSSSLRFEGNRVTMRVKRATIGKKVTWKGTGDSGMVRGRHGADGTHLMLDVVFLELQQLTIDTRGGAGFTGASGRVGSYGTSGENGQNGGNGGDGGDIHLRYRCIGFTPIFGRGKSNSILLKYKGGSGGTGGMAGTRSTAMGSARPGQPGEKGMDGKLTLHDVTNPQQREEEAASLWEFDDVDASKNEYSIVIEMLSFVASVLNQPNRTTHLYRALKELNKSMQLGLVLENKKFESLSVTLPGKATLTLTEMEASIHEISNLCEYVKPAISHRLDSAKFDYNYPEYITDYILTSIDNGSSFVPTKLLQYSNRKNSSQGFHFCKDSSGRFLINRVYANSQAFKSGLRAGDRITDVKGIPSAYLGGGEFYRLIDLDSGQNIAISLERDGQMSTMTLPGEWSNPASMKEKMERLPDDVLYLRPGELSLAMASKIRTFINNEDAFNAILLDLRDCPGGHLQESADIASIFVDQGDTITKVLFSNRPASPEFYRGTSKQPVKPKAMLVLTNANTGSGAEVIAAALKYNKVAKIVGLPTYGLGEIMTHLYIGRRKYVIRIKAGELYTPEGISISSSPVQPDIVVENGVDMIPFALELIRKN